MLYENIKQSTTDIINVYISPEFVKLTPYITCIPFVEMKQEQQNTDYIIGVRGVDIRFLPKIGMIVRGNDMQFPTNTFNIECTFIFRNEKYFFLRRKNVTPYYANLSYVVQGITVDTTLDLLCILFLYGRVIVSTWDVYDFQSIQTKVQSNNYHNNQNIYYQIYTTLNGLYKVKTAYTIKVRADEMYADFTSLLELLDKSSNKIITTNIFIRPVKLFPYHCSDHIIAGSTKNMLKMFHGGLLLLQNKINESTMFHKSILWVPEQVLTIGFLCNTYPLAELLPRNCAYIMNKHFTCVELFKFKMFKVMYINYVRKGKPRKVEVRKVNFHLHSKIIHLKNYEHLSFIEDGA